MSFSVMQKILARSKIEWYFMYAPRGQPYLFGYYKDYKIIAYHLRNAYIAQVYNEYGSHEICTSCFRDLEKGISDYV